LQRIYFCPKYRIARPVIPTRNPFVPDALNGTIACRQLAGEMRQSRRFHTDFGGPPGPYPPKSTPLPPSYPRGVLPNYFLSRALSLRMNSARKIAFARNQAKHPFHRLVIQSSRLQSSFHNCVVLLSGVWPLLAKRSRRICGSAARRTFPSFRAQ
jgi:hypothetical protein